MLALDICLLAVLAYLLAVTGYLVLVTLAAVAYRKPAEPGAPPQSMAVVIPAHNEELQIAGTVATLLDVRYPQDRFAVFVIADNCDDETAPAARNAGATVVERHVPDKRGKGQALDWFFTTHDGLVRPFDVVAIIDADTHADSRFLEEVSASMSRAGVSILQTFDGVSNPGRNWRTALTYAGFALMNHVRACGRDRLGGSSGLKGNGMAFRTGILLERGWPAHSIVEDMELSTRLLLDGYTVRYNPDAVLTSEMPAARREADTQRRRWESGRFQLSKRFVPVLLRAFAIHRKWRFLDALLDLLVPPLSLLVMAQALLLVLTFALRPVWLPLAACCAAGTAVHVIAGLAISRAPARVWLYLLAVPAFLLWKIPLYVGILFGRKQRTWQRTVRQAELERKDEP